MIENWAPPRCFCVWDGFGHGKLERRSRRSRNGWLWAHVGVHMVVRGYHIMDVLAYAEKVVLICSVSGPY